MLHALLEVCCVEFPPLAVIAPWCGAPEPDQACRRACAPVSLAACRHLAGDLFGAEVAAAAWLLSDRSSHCARHVPFAYLPPPVIQPDIRCGLRAGASCLFPSGCGFRRGVHARPAVPGRSVATPCCRRCPPSAAAAAVPAAPGCHARTRRTFSALAASSQSCSWTARRCLTCRGYWPTGRGGEGRPPAHTPLPHTHTLIPSGTPPHRTARHSMATLPAPNDHRHRSARCSASFRTWHADGTRFPARSPALQAP